MLLKAHTGLCHSLSASRRRGAKGYCVRVDSVDDLRPGATWELQPVPHLASLSHLDNVYCVTAFDLWCASYFWMIQVVSGTAGGDTNQWDLLPYEQLCFALINIFACLLMSRIVASFCDVLSNLNPEHSAFRQRMDQLNRYCREKRLERHTRRQLREYLYRVKHVQTGNSQRELMRIMSPKLQGVLSLHVNGSWIPTVAFLRPLKTRPGAEIGCCVRIALSLTPAVYIPTELLPADCLYHLTSGTLVHRGSVIAGNGRIWGDDCVLSRIDLRARPARALTYVEVEQISRDTLLSIVMSSAQRTDEDGMHVEVFEFPAAVRRLRWHAVMLGMMRECARIKGEVPGQSQQKMYQAWTKSFKHMASGMDDRDELPTDGSLPFAAPLPSRTKSRARRSSQRELEARTAILTEVAPSSPDTASTPSEPSDARGKSSSSFQMLWA